MGSLMSGWNSPAHHPTKVKYMRNQSMTKLEVDAYRKSNKKADEEHHVLPSPSSSSSSDYKAFTKSVSLPPMLHHLHHDDDDDITFLHHNSCSSLWRGSNSAFLNKPPVIATPEKPRMYSYTPLQPHGDGGRSFTGIYHNYLNRRH